MVTFYVIFDKEIYAVHRVPERTARSWMKAERGHTNSQVRRLASHPAPSHSGSPSASPMATSGSAHQDQKLHSVLQISFQNIVVVRKREKYGTCYKVQRQSTISLLFFQKARLCVELIRMLLYGPYPLVGSAPSTGRLFQSCINGGPPMLAIPLVVRRSQCRYSCNTVAARLSIV
jgi:hypothetical protein